LLIRGAETADISGADEQALEVNCSMAQAFEIPRGNRTVYRGLLATGQAAIAKYPATLSRSPLPVRPSDWIGIEKYGPGIGLLQASGRCPGTTRDPSESRPGDRPKVNHFWRI
jgi:hypothetical protein